MNYIYQYDLAATLLLVILLALYFTRHNYPTATNRLYIAMVICSLSSSVFDLIAIGSEIGIISMPVWLIYLVNMLYLAAYNGTGILFYIYLLIITKQRRLKGHDKIPFLIAILIDVVVIFSSPVTHMAFRITENGQYVRGSMMLMLYVTALGLLLGDIILFARYHSRLTRFQIFSIYFFVILTIASALIQLLLPGQLVSNFICAVFLVLVYVSLQNPDDYINKQTHCYNSSAFLETAEKNIERDNPFSIVAFMPDDFVYINQLLGIKTGNEFINQTADFLLSKYGKKTVYHLSGCRFAVIPDEGRASSEQIVEDIREHFSKPLDIGGMKIMLTPYICIIRYPDFVSSADEIYDALEYSFKEMAANRENHVLVASAESLEAKRRENKIVHIMKRALAENSFQVYYQPIYSVAEGTFTSAEALVRLRDEELGFISPEEFIPMAERNGMIVEIGETVMRNVCEFLKSGRAWSLGIKYIEVNLSVVQCMQDNLAERMLAIMEEYGIPCSSVNFEITETAGSANDEALRRNMNRLIERGSTFAMDDYGTGFSTANYLISLPMHIVKIDKSILWPAMKDKEAFLILWHTVQMLKELKKKIVVEGVETEEMRKVLSEMGCDYLQGYLFSRPVSGDDILRYLQENNCVKGE